MKTFSLFKMLVVVMVLAVLFACILTPRGRINPESAGMIRDGMSVDQVSKIIGLPVGWHDGILPDKSMAFWNSWANRNGMITVDLRPDGSIEKARFGKLESYHSVSISDSLRDRTLGRLFNPYSTISMLASFALVVFGVGSTLIKLGSYFRIQIRLPFMVSAMVASVVYLALMRFAYGDWVGPNHPLFGLFLLMTLGMGLLTLLLAWLSQSFRAQAVQPGECA